MTSKETTERELLLRPGKNPQEVTPDLCRPLDKKAGLLWWMAFLLSLSALLLGAAAVVYQVRKGVGTWGLDRSVGWAFDVTNFVFWIGIGHAGTFISAILYLLRRKWRTSISRSAEAVTLLALLCAALFPLVHMGRPWLAFWMFPYPNFRGPLWINFRSPLVWDFFAIGTYFSISLLFWYLGLLPDLATLRKRYGGWRGRLFSWFSLGWDGSQRTWARYETVYLLIAGLATALVISVHSIVSWDFAASLLPGWHTTILPPYFVIGAVYSGMAMVLMLSIILRQTLELGDYITSRHLDVMSKLLLFGSLVLLLTYVSELFYAAYSQNPYELAIQLNRLTGKMQIPFLIMLVCNVGVTQLLWSGRVRRRPGLLLLISISINCGMWLERYIIVVGSLERDFLVSSWTDYVPTSIEVATMIGSFGLFFTLFLLLCRSLPIISMSEIRALLAERRRSS